MVRLLFALVVLAPAVGCAGTTDLLTSKTFRSKPIDTLFKKEDPMAVLRTSPEGDARARAMRKLKEPAVHGHAEYQDEVIQLLTAAATADPSPVVRSAAVDCLGRFKDPRAVGILTAAYHNAGGGSVARAESPAAALAGPSGFPPEMVSLIRMRVVESLAATGRADAVPVLTQVAVGTGDFVSDRDVRLAAVRGLGTLRVPESAVALHKVLAAEKGKDAALSGRAHEGLVVLTGANLPADPAAWDTVVTGPNAIGPAPGGLQRAVNWVEDQ